MNQRIKELAEQAGITTNLDTDYFQKDPNKWVDYFAEKFAELIIQECMDIANKNRSAMEIDRQTNLTADAIRKHFGVEE